MSNGNKFSDMKVEKWVARPVFDQIGRDYWPIWSLSERNQERFRAHFAPYNPSVPGFDGYKAACLAMVRRIERVPIYEHAIKMALQFHAKYEMALIHLGEPGFARLVCKVRRDLACALQDGAILPPLPELHEPSLYVG